MNEDNKKFSPGKGSRPRNIFSKEFRKNYDEIEWSYKGEQCCRCGLKLNKNVLQQRPDLFVFHEDGEIEHKNCNFN